MNTSTDRPLAVSVVDATRYAPVSRSTLYEHIATGELPSVLIGRRRLIRLDDLDAWLQRHYAHQVAA